MSSKISSDKYTYSNEDNVNVNVNVNHHNQQQQYSASNNNNSNNKYASKPTTTATTTINTGSSRDNTGSIGLNSNGRESLNSLEDSSVKNSQSGLTDGAVSFARANKNSSINSNNNNSSIMGSNDTLSRSINNQRETLHSRFDFIKVLGKGTYGKVKLANDKRTGRQVAIKIIHKNRIENKQDLARVRREIEFMSRLNHPHIVKILEVYESSEKIILVMEYASGGELYDYLNERKRVSEVEARGIFRQIVSAVHFLHKNRIVHRDLKLENILIDSNGDIKLADFGLSNNWSPNNLLYTFCGSPLYASPEIVNGFPYFGPEVDCWSLGVLLYTLVYGSMPFQGGDYNRLVKQISDGQFIVPRERSGAFGLIKRCLCVKAAKRASIDDIAEHWWVNVGYAYPPVVFYSYVPGASRTGVQALGYEGSPKVSPSLPLASTIGKKNAMTTVSGGTVATSQQAPPPTVY